MAFGDLPLDAPCKPNKGYEGGACNRQSCQAEPASWYNNGSHSWYCGDCARDIGEDIVNRRNWALAAAEASLAGRPVGPSMFETRQMIDERKERRAEEEQAAAVGIDPCSFEALFGQSPYDALFAGKPRAPKSASLERMLRKARR